MRSRTFHGWTMGFPGHPRGISARGLHQTSSAMGAALCHGVERLSTIKSPREGGCRVWDC